MLYFESTMKKNINLQHFFVFENEKDKKIILKRVTSQQHENQLQAVYFSNDKIILLKERFLVEEGVT